MIGGCTGADMQPVSAKPTQTSQWHLSLGKGLRHLFDERYPLGNFGVHGHGYPALDLEITRQLLWG